MFDWELIYRNFRIQSVEAGRRYAQADGASKLWAVGERVRAKPDPMGRCVFAQNDVYLELSNPGWSAQWAAFLAVTITALALAFVLWLFYGTSVHPLFTGRMFILWGELEEPRRIGEWLFGWILFFPVGLILFVFWQFHVYPYIFKGAFFTLARGRIRFNRKTRKVYVLRPNSAGGNVVLDWDRTCAVTVWKPSRGRYEDHPIQVRALLLYYPSSDANNPGWKGEDCIFVGPTLSNEDDPAPLWRYISVYMEFGRGRGGVPARLPYGFTTFCGKPSRRQYQLETRRGFLITTLHMLSQVTCNWPRFPKEWESDGGLGEPEDHPVRTGAVMTAMVHRAEGKLSREDEVEFLTRWEPRIRWPMPMPMPMPKRGLRHVRRRRRRIPWMPLVLGEFLRSIKKPPVEGGS